MDKKKRLEQQSQFTPVFVHNDKRFVIANRNWLGSTEQIAREIGWGSFVEAVLQKFRFTGEIVSLNALSGYEAKLGGTPIYLLDKPKKSMNKGVESAQQNRSSDSQGNRVL